MLTRGFRFGVGGVDGTTRFSDSGFEAECFLDEGHVVVDGLRNADHAERHASFGRGLGDFLCAAQCAVAADGKQDADLAVHQGLQHFVGVLWAAGGAQQAAAGFVNAADVFRREAQRLVTEARHQSFVAEPETQYVSHAVLMIEVQHHRTNHIVKTRAEPPARDDATGNLRRIEKELLPRPAGFHRRGQLALCQDRADFLEPRVIKNTLIVSGETHFGEWRGDAALSEPVNGEIECVGQLWLRDFVMPRKDTSIP